MKADKNFMKFAIKKAKQGIEKGQTPFGACIVRDREVISCCHNQVWADNDITAHSEILAIREACKKLGSIDLSDCVIYSTCEPCTMCFSACHWAKISGIIYGVKIEDARKFGFNELLVSNTELKDLSGFFIDIIGDVLREECLTLFKLWTERKDKKVY